MRGNRRWYNRVVTDPSDAEIAWCAGLFEGEGNIGVARHAPYEGRFEPRLQIRQTDEDVLVKFQSLMGGRLTGPFLQGDADSKRYKVAPKPYWIWVVSSWDEFERIGSLLRPWLGKRRGERFDLVLATMPDHFRRPFAYRPCDYAPTPSVAGYLKHRRRGERACEVCLESNRLYYAGRAARAQVDS